ncbi:MAG: Flagellar motor switch protein FliN [Alphaproteobacteria bacterium ADurb.Bin438]|nr:MAG: Flagellar motor switch protein FliN [Alphaproteobacteria bacterium ADurb.Bin438]
MVNEQTEIDKMFNDDAVFGVDVDVSVVLGTSMLRVHQLLKLGRGAVVELNQKISDPVEIYANDILVARGEVIVIGDDKIGVTLTEMIMHQNSRKVFNKSY